MKHVCFKFLAAVSVLAVVAARPAVAQETSPPSVTDVPAAPATAPASVAPALQPQATSVAPEANTVAATTAVEPKPVVRKKAKPAVSYSASKPMAIPPTPWSSVPTLDPDSLERLNILSRYYAQIARNGGFPPTPPVGTGSRSSGPQIEALRRRLVMERDLPEAAGSGQQWDSDLGAAVVRFQMRYGIPATGTIDQRTFAQMNVPVHKRLEQIGRNMERLGARFINFNTRYVVVNIPSAQVEAVENGRVARRYVAVAGRPQNPSPQVDATISAINFNPTWTVPASIIKKEIGPHMVRDPSYVRRQNMKVLDASGKEVDPASVDWSSAKAANYVVRQNSGTGNALGQLRIQMPNSEAVYMHDTPSKKLFGSTDRFFSHGCVRVQGVNDLAAWLLGPDWDAKRVAQQIATGERKDIAIADKVPVHWVYMTAYVTPDGTAQFRPDFYGLDSGRTQLADVQ